MNGCLVEKLLHSVLAKSKSRAQDMLSFTDYPLAERVFDLLYALDGKSMDTITGAGNIAERLAEFLVEYAGDRSQADEESCVLRGVPASALLPYCAAWLLEYEAQKTEDHISATEIAKALAVCENKPAVLSLSDELIYKAWHDWIERTPRVSGMRRLTNAIHAELNDAAGIVCTEEVTEEQLEKKLALAKALLARTGH
jgi:hypothetical protein